MPGFVTHYLFGVETYHEIDQAEIREKIRRNHAAYSIGLQGPDIFFYYLPSYYLHPHNLGNIAHSFRTNAFFANLIKGRNRLIHDQERLAIADAYICGFIGHYTLDTYAHPFIYAHTKYNAFNEPSTKDYFGQHAYLETEIDNTMLWKDKKMIPSQLWMNGTIRLNRKERAVIAYIVSRAFNETYGEDYPEMDVTMRQVKDAMHWMFGLCKIMNDPTGVKKRFVRKMEDIFIGKPLVSAMIPSDTVVVVKDPMNQAHKPWKHPWTGAYSKASLYEKIDQAKRKYNNRIVAWYQLTDSGMAPELKTAFLEDYGNLSFSSGLPITKDPD